MSGTPNPPTVRWVQDAIEQARIILAHLEAGGCDENFLRPHALTLLQTIDLIPESGQEGGCYLM